MVLVGVGIFQEISDTKDHFNSYHSVIISLRKTIRDLRENND